MTTARKIKRGRPRIYSDEERLTRRRERQRKYYEDNPDRILACQKRYRERNPDRVRARGKNFRIANRAKLTTKQRLKRKKNPASFRDQQQRTMRKRAALISLARSLIGAGVVPVKLLQHYGLAA